MIEFYYVIEFLANWVFNMVSVGSYIEWPWEIDKENDTSNGVCDYVGNCVHLIPRILLANLPQPMGTLESTKMMELKCHLCKKSNWK